MAYPVLQSVSASAGAIQTATTIAAPAGIANNDILFATIYVESLGASPTPPAGWSLVTSYQHSIGFAVYYYWKRAASESGNYIFSLGVNSYAQGSVSRISGCPLFGNPINVYSTQSTGTSTNATAISVTTTVAETLVLVSVHDWAGYNTSTPPVGYTEYLDNAYTHLAWGQVANPSASGSQTTILAIYEAWMATQFAFAPNVGTMLAPNGINNATVLATPILNSLESLNLAPVNNATSLSAPTLQILNGSITVSWTPSDDTNVTGYYVKYGTSTGEYTQEIDVPGRITASIELTSLTVGQQYFINITSHGAGGHDTFESELLGEVSATAIDGSVISLAVNSIMQPTALTNTDLTQTNTLVVTTVANTTSLQIPSLLVPNLDGSLQVSWTISPDTSVTGYYVYYGTSTGVYTQEVDVSGRTTSSITLTSLVPGQQYFINISSHGSGGHDAFESELLGEVTATATVSGTLTVADVSNITSLQTAALNQANTLVVANINDTSILETPSIVLPGVLGITNVANGHSIEAITLALPGTVTLATNAIANAQTLESFLLTSSPPSVVVIGTVPIILAELSVNSANVETTRYLSNLGFISESTDTPANTNYLPLLTGNIETTETISITGTPSFSFTDLEVLNADGALDSWLTDVWTNRSIKLYLGYRGQVRNVFTLIFDGIIADIGTKSRTSLNLKVRDKLQRLNAPLSETTLGGSTVNKESIIPYTFGEVFNISPLLTNDPTHEYQVCGAAIEDIIEVRDNGVPVSVTEFLSTGKFNLLARPAGAITASVQGYKPTTYVNDIANTIKNIVLNFGKAVDRFQLADIDTGNFSTFSTNFPQSIGYYVNNKENIISIIQFLANSIGAQVLCNRLGKLQLFQVGISGSSTFTITPAMIVFGSLSIVNRPEVQSSVLLNYAKNHVAQNSLETGVVPTSKELLGEEWSSVTQTDSAVATLHKHSALPTAIDTALINTTEATAEALRRLNLWKTQRTVFQLTGTSDLAGITIGQIVTLQHTRFNLSSGVLGMVISVKMDWTTNRPTLQILV